MLLASCLLRIPPEDLVDSTQETVVEFPTPVRFYPLNSLINVLVAKSGFL